MSGTQDGTEREGLAEKLGASHVEQHESHAAAVRAGHQRVTWGSLAAARRADAEREGLDTDDELEMELRRANNDDDPLIAEYQEQVATLTARLAAAEAERDRWRDSFAELSARYVEHAERMDAATYRKTTGSQQEAK